MTKHRKNPIRDNEFFRYVSTKKYLKIFVPGFAFKHDNSFEGKDKFVGREVQLRRLFLWLTSTSRSGSYLITGYRGMGKSLLVNRVLKSISREKRAWPELLFNLGVICAFFACVLLMAPIASWKWYLIGVLSILSASCLVAMLFHKQYYYFKFVKESYRWGKKGEINMEERKKYIIRYNDGRDRVFWRIPISINLGQEILNERDVLSVIAYNVKSKYSAFVNSRQKKPLLHYIPLLLLCLISTALAYKCMGWTNDFLLDMVKHNDGFFQRFVTTFQKVFSLDNHPWRFMTMFLVTSIGLFIALYYTIKKIRMAVPYFSTPYKAINRLDVLCERISAAVNEENSSNSSMKNGWFSFSLFNRSRKKGFPLANVREIEQELQEIINSVNSPFECPKAFMAQFIIVFDELDKVANTEESDRNIRQESGNMKVPEFDASLEGFTGTMGFEERKREVLRLLANMKLFITTVQAKCVFISGHELFDASLADLSDREFAISSIFNGVLNVDSFLSPEREQNEVSSMTELYLATLLLPENYVMEKMSLNVEKNGVLKEELPSLRWYNDYLLSDMMKQYKEEVEIQQREQEIQFAVEFLRHFAVFLAHISNGSPKKIATYFEKYIKTEYDTKRIYEWGDEIIVGHPVEKDPMMRCVLWFDSNMQRFINFVYYIASPIMKTITNETSHFGDKLLVTSSFILDQIYKYHGKGFSWRNLEQMPELLNSNKNPELRDSMASMMEFLLQTHITRISSGINQYKFHKQISEEITFMSMTSEEASAIFNFTLNESMTVKRYNLRLLSHYLKLSQTTSDASRYDHVLERLHENLGDIYYMDEDYYCAIHEYSNALSYLAIKDEKPEDVIAFLKCCLKIGMSYEYRRTYENAYMMYCQIINRLIHLRWVDEKALGLDYTWRWTKDWRLKQPLLVNTGTLEEQSSLKKAKRIVKMSGNEIELYQDPTENEVVLKDLFKEQFNTGVWDDVEKEKDINPEYSTGTDNIISALAYNYTPEKSDVVKRLTVFEDIRYIYLAIIAKLFVIEKMELGGVSYSSIEIAEAEFLYLHSATNVLGKFVISADFYHKMAEIMYYKNGYVTPLPNVNSLVSALYFYDVNLLSLIDDFCFLKCKDGKNNAVYVKGVINDYFKSITFGSCMERAGDTLYDKLNGMVGDSDDGEMLRDYLKYSKEITLDKADDKLRQIRHCSLRREVMSKIGFKLPCNACRYAFRSLEILMDNLFVDENIDSKANNPRVSKVLRLLYLTSRKHIRHIRQSELTVLANTIEQMGDIMLSCSLTRTKDFDLMSKVQHSSLSNFDWESDYHFQDDISIPVMELLDFLSGEPKPEVQRKERIDKASQMYLSKLDKSLLFYWAASRFYEMASLYKEAAACMERMLKVICGYLKVIGSDVNASESRKNVVKKLYGNCDVISEGDESHFHLVNNLFQQASKYVGMEYDNHVMGDIHEHKWLFHFERMDDIDLSKLSEFSDLKSTFLIAVDTKIRILDYLRKVSSTVAVNDYFENAYKEYIARVYQRISYPLRHDNTFKEEVVGYYMKAYVNKLIMVDCLGKDVMLVEKSKHMKNPHNTEELDFHILFYKQLSVFLNKKEKNKRLDGLIFNASDIQSRLKLVEFLIQDSVVCLSSILSILTPHNHITTFSNVFMAEVYDLLWEWSKYYELLYDLYIYRKYDELFDEDTQKAIVGMISRNTTNDTGLLSKQMKSCLETIRSVFRDKDNGGYQYSRLLMSIRHDIDDATMHHLFANISAEMSTKYYKMAKDVNNEGPAYKDMITVMYVLDDDLHNDTCQSNLADERYLWHCGIIDRNRDMMLKMYEQSNINKMESIEQERRCLVKSNQKRLNDRLEDSIYINSEY